MSVDAFRIIKTRYIANALDGEGARLHGGRWNSVGVRMVYLAGSLSGATLELLVHTDDYDTIRNLFSYIPITIPEACINVLDAGRLPPDWNAPMVNAATQELGDQWIASMSSAVLRVSSAITDGEVNYLCNPAHDDFSKLIVGAARTFRLDPRL